MKIKGRVVLLVDKEGKLISNVDTDQIFHNAHLHITDIDEMGKYALGNLKGYENYSGLARENDIIITGHNFGAGSSRQQAVDCFKALRVGIIIAPSFGAIYKRNAINSALPILECPEIEKYVENRLLNKDDIVTINFEEGRVENYKGEIIQCRKPSRVQLDILKAGGLFNYGKSGTPRV